MYIFVFLICAINLILTYKILTLIVNIMSVVRTNLLKKSFDNTDIEDLKIYKDFFDIDDFSN